MESDEGAEQGRPPLAERARDSRPAADIRQSPGLGRRLDTWGWIALVVGAALYGLGEGAGSTEGVDWAGQVLVLFGLWAVLRGRRHLSWVLPDIGAVSQGEGAVLFLRAFSDERGFARTVASRPLRWLLGPPVTPSELRTEEEQIARGVAPFGRMVALGPTSDRWPRVGANRSYASDEEWQSNVLAALDRADLVLLATGPGNQLQWEVEQVVGRDDPTRLVLVVPRTPGQYAGFRETFGDLFPQGLPEAPGGRASRVRYVRAVVWFEPDWTPHLQLLTGRLPLFRFAARTQRALPRALQHVYERAGAPTPVENRTARPRPPAVTAGVALFSACCLGFAAWLYYVLLVSPGQLTADLLGGPGSTNGSHLVGLVAAALVVAVLWTTLLVGWMHRVLRAGPFAVLALQVVGIESGMSAIVVGIQQMSYDAAAWILLGTLVLVVFAVAPLLFPAAVLLLRRDVREWVDSRT